MANLLYLVLKSPIKNSWYDHWIMSYAENNKKGYEYGLHDLHACTRVINVYSDILTVEY